ncbi:hypothetical protein N657DRAFT_682057 [Parathielavia appendiculata]|uniref:Uncharacterized protein n=1 Tax=Parathielavia appendiculata TaxID=2587402 RepID=A0AAN6Z1U6_9PEZI|nr:hypothetical protein N657DRAFT_682057 [Parathielavia appendiculata]
MPESLPSLTMMFLMFQSPAGEDNPMPTAMDNIRQGATAQCVVEVVLIFEWTENVATGFVVISIDDSAVIDATPNSLRDFVGNLAVRDARDARDDDIRMEFHQLQGTELIFQTAVACDTPRLQI